MPKHILFVCQSCHHSSGERPKDQPADGDRLLEQLNTLSGRVIDELRRV
jgi:predicted metal-binding protein